MGRAATGPLLQLGSGSEWSDHNTSCNANQFGLQLKSDMLEIVHVRGVVLFQHTHSLVSFDAETWATAFSVHSLLQLGSFNLCHSDTNKPTLAAPSLLPALEGPCEHHDHAKCWNGTSCTPGRFVQNSSFTQAAQQVWPTNQPSALR